MGSIITKVIFENNNGFVKSFFLSIAVQLFQFISIILILFSLKIDSNLVEILFVFIISSILSVFSFGGIGIREYIFYSAAYVLTISEEFSTSIGLLFTISAVICSIHGFYFSIKKPNKILGFIKFYESIFLVFQIHHHMVPNLCARFSNHYQLQSKQTMLWYCNQLIIRVIYSI